MNSGLPRHRCLQLLALFAYTPFDRPAIAVVNAWIPSCRSATWRPFTARHALGQPSTDAATATTMASRPVKSAWFPIHPADALSPNNDYDTIVKAAYLRHVLLETEEMADLIVDLYLSGGRLRGAGNFVVDEDGDIGNHVSEASNAIVLGLGLTSFVRRFHYGIVSPSPLFSEQSDVFARLARRTSTCTHTRLDGGEIGWVDNPQYRGRDSAIPSALIQEVFRRRVKGGDVLKLPIGIQATDNHNNSNNNTSPHSLGWHVIRVDDLHLRPIHPISSASEVPSKNVINKIRPKLKGSGVVPLSPVFQKNAARDNCIEDIPDNEEEGWQWQNEEEEEEDRPRRMIYSIPNAKYYKIVTTGCQMNVADSERIMGVLEGELGLTSLDADSNDDTSGMDASLIATLGKKKNKSMKHEESRVSKKASSNKNSATPDILLLNTCTIRDHAEQKVYDALGPYAAMKRSGHPLAIVVAGCVAQQEGEALLRRFPEIDLVLGPQYIPWLSDLLVEVGKGSQLCMTESMLWSETGGSDGRGWNSSREKDADWMVPIKRGHTVRAWVNVIHGCNEHCTYCVVPSVRGVEQSRSMEAILQECLQLASSGYKEVTLLGQNIDAYGRDMNPRRTFADLLHYLNDNLPPNTISRIRYVTSHPRYFSERVIEAVSDLDKVCECFHMPFQAGDDAVLRDMRRGYTYESYMNIIRKIRAKAPDASICGDVIVGFPGETEEAFQRTLDLMEEVKFDNLNTFAYSPRPNTEAADWANQIPTDVKSDRLQRVQALAAKHALERSQRYVGTAVEVLVEDRNPKNGNEVMGRTRQGRQVFFEGDIKELKGQLVMVEVLEGRTWSLVGKLLSSPIKV
ncbi:hypothetical protein HJC23_006285 [Cyclotella cryptica]|uniref:Peptidylprolyl isomerase n=1 Tax=Cyclotella cryptica TaxID=29204 RepID=A0ABD3P2P6_9STRA